MNLSGTIVAVHRSSAHTFSKKTEEQIALVAGHGVDGDAHAGKTVRHRSRVAVDPTQPNLRQVHLIHAELHEELRAAGFWISPGDMGENITTHGLELLRLPTGTLLHVGPKAVIELTGLRNPCQQLDRFQPGLMSAVLSRDCEGRLIRKAGVMGVVVSSGIIEPGDTVRAELPPEPHVPLDRV
jgi:MOSC domain-containing protein YiiM